MDLAPNRYHGHSDEALDTALLDAQKAIEDAHAAQIAARQRGLVGEAAQADMENRGVSYSDESEMASKTADKQLAAAKARLNQIERQYALRGVTGDALAERIQAAQELRAEREGMRQDEALSGLMGDDPFADPAPVSAPVAAEAGPALATVKGTGPTRTRGLSAGVEAKAVENKLTQSLGDLPEYKQVSMADQAAKATDLLTRDPALARRIALGQEPAPDHILPEAIFTAVENKAIESGDASTLYDLAHGDLTRQGTTMGQRIRALGERDPESPVDAIKEVNRVRSSGKNVEKQTLSTVKEIESHFKDLKVTEGAWKSFIDSLKC